MRLIRHITVIPVLLLFLFSLGGFTVFRHACKMSGTSSASFFTHVDDCCGIKKEVKKSCCETSVSKKTTKPKDSCCTHSSFSKQLKVETNVDRAQVWVFFAFTLIDFPVFSFIQLKPQRELISFSDSSPPLPVDDLLIKHCVFRI